MHHVGTLPTLEDQMTTFEPGARKSPDRLDALVYALTELMVEAGTTGMIGFYREEAQALRASGLAGPSFGWGFGGGTDERGDLVRLVSPPGTTTVMLMSGAFALPDVNGVISCHESDARPLRMIGWRDALEIS